MVLTVYFLVKVVREFSKLGQRLIDWLYQDSLAGLMTGNARAFFEA